MKKILVVLTLFFLACNKSESAPDHDMVDPNAIYAYDANGERLGTVEERNDSKGYAYIRTSEGYLDMLQYGNGKPFGKWHEKVPTSPAGQEWMFYPISWEDKIYLIVPQGTTITEKISLAAIIGSRYTPPARYCLESSDPVTLEGGPGKDLYFYVGQSNGYIIYQHNINQNSDDTYLKYKDGVLTSTVSAYLLKTEGCGTNQEIGYPEAVDESFGLKGPITLEKGDGTPVPITIVPNR